MFTPIDIEIFNKVRSSNTIGEEDFLRQSKKKSIITYPISSNIGATMEYPALNRRTSSISIKSLERAIIFVPETNNYNKKIQILLTILSWYLFSGLLSVYNKWLFGKKQKDFGYPLFVTVFHMIMQYLISIMVIHFLPRMRSKKTPSSRNYLYQIVPCALASAFDIGLSNLSLQTITLTFYTMCKSSVVVFVLFFAFIFKLEKPSINLILVISLICFGVFFMAYGETAFDRVGFTQVMLASLMSGLRWSMAQMLMEKEKFGMTNPFLTLSYLTPIMAFALFILSNLIENPLFTIGKTNYFATFSDAASTIFLILSGGFFATAMVVSEFFLIIQTSVLTLAVVGILKEVLTLSLGMIVFGDKITSINFFGLLMTLAGIVIYNYIKINKDNLPQNFNNLREPVGDQTDDYFELQDNISLSDNHNSHPRSSNQ
ncbi:hypothetical protein BB561_001368 [Smittium simulii]|uniref:Sugar phosphate transporter domain-containing protein n=1 Tax=Smittium simulii TaxID=133385 RepID=A0A2T9YUT7_9FUNG|nr:hypothetical protein BB561_001368 [Smittium simulii]